jgi:hypothetical protein
LAVIGAVVGLSGGVAWVGLLSAAAPAGAVGFFAAIQVTKTADPSGPVTAGNNIGFHIVVANPVGSLTTTGVSLNDPLPATPAGIGTWSISSGPSGTASPLPTCAITSGTLTCSAVDLAFHTSYALTVTAATAITTNGTATNTASATSTNGNCTSGSTDTACSSTAMVTITPPTCPAGQARHLLTATTNVGTINGLFCVNPIIGIGTYTQLNHGSVSGTGIVQQHPGTTQIAAFGTNLNLAGNQFGSINAFGETAPVSAIGTFSLS